MLSSCYNEYLTESLYAFMFNKTFVIVIVMTLHFFGLNLSCHLSCHACSCMRSCCSSWKSRTDFTDLYITQSSANSRTVDVVCLARSLMKIRNSSGPSTNPCGTPNFTDAGPHVSPSTTSPDHHSLGSSLKKRPYSFIQVTIKFNTIAFQLPEESLVGNGVKSFGKIQDKYVHFAALVHHFCEIMACQLLYELSLAGASFAKAMLCIYQYHMFIKMVQNVSIDDVFQDLT